MKSASRIGPSLIQAFRACAAPRRLPRRRAFDDLTRSPADLQLHAPPRPAGSIVVVVFGRIPASTRLSSEPLLGLLDERPNGGVQPRPRQRPLNPLQHLRRREIADALRRTDGGGGDARVIDD